MIHDPTPRPARVLVTLLAASRELSVPYETVKSWKRRSLLSKSGITLEGTALYDLAEVRRLAETTKRRKRRRK